MTTQQHQGSSSTQSGSGNFRDDPQKASEAGRKGGQHSHQGGSGSSTEKRDTSGTQQRSRSGDMNDESNRAHPGRNAGQDGQSESSRSGGSDDQASGESQGQAGGGSGNFASDPQRASEAGRKGGHNSHGGR